MVRLCISGLKKNDKVPHKSVIWKPEYAGEINGGLLKWMKDYLENWEMRTAVRGIRSNWWKELNRWLNDADAQYIEPYEAFDNVFYVGVCWVSSWLIKTEEGAVLIDTLTGPFSEQLIRNIESVGVKPEDIKLVLMTHGHFDHTGGASRLKELSNAQFVMTKAGWQEAFEDANKKPKAYWDNRFLAKDSTSGCGKQPQRLQSAGFEG